MLHFADKLQDEDITLSWNATNVLPVGAILSSATVTVAVYEYSDTTDDNPSALKSGTAQINSDDVTLDDGVVVATGKAALQKVTGGVEGATYLITFLGTCNDASSSKVAEQGLLEVVPRFEP